MCIWLFFITILIFHFLLPFIYCNFPSKLNIISISNNQDLLAEAYKNTLLEILHKTEARVDDEESVRLIQKCRRGIVVQYALSKYTKKGMPNVFFNMYVATGLQENDFGDYDMCMSINVKSNRTVTIFAVVEGYGDDLLLKRMEFGICVPEQCVDMVEAFQRKSKRFYFYNSYMKIFKFPKEDGPKKVIHIIWLRFFYIWIYCIVILNVIMTCFVGNYNPYDTEDLHFPQNRTSTPYASPYYFSNVVNFSNTSTDNLVNLITTQNAEIQTQHVHWFKRIYFDYLSIQNNLFLLTRTKSIIYNDSKLRFANGTMFLFCLWHIFACTFELLEKVSKPSMHSDLFFYALSNIISVIGNLYLDIISTIWGFLLTYKFLNYVKIKDSLGKLKVLFWLIRQSDKLIVFIYLNMMFLFSFDYMVYLYNPSCILWFLYEDKVKNCNWYNFLPLYDFYALFVTNSDFSPHCLNSNRIFFEGMYLLCFTFIILGATVDSKHKLRTLVVLFIVSAVGRFLFSSMFLMDYMNKSNLNRLKPTHTLFDYLHNQFFYNVPNLILGIIVGYVYYRDQKIEEITKMRHCDYFNDLDVIRVFFTKPMVRNIVYILSVLTMFIYIGTSNFYIIYLPDFLYYPMINMSGLICSFSLCFIFLSVQLKGQEDMWEFNHVIVNFSNRLIKSPIVLMFSRCLFNINMSHLALLYAIILNHVKDPVYFDFFNVVIIFGIPVCIIILAFGFSVTLFFEIPLRIGFKRGFGLKSIIMSENANE